MYRYTLSFTNVGFAEKSQFAKALPQLQNSGDTVVVSL